ncbi:sirohydrochlorin cobaltochelatase [uncultured Gammaproteobacteria bacterium]
MSKHTAGDPHTGVSDRVGIVLCGHGTRHADGAREFKFVADGVRAALPAYTVSHGFLELSDPLLPEALETLYAQGFRRLVVTPCMLFAAGHAKTDIPLMLRAFQAFHPDVRLTYGRALGIDPGLLDAAATRIGEALDLATPGVPREKTLLLGMVACFLGGVVGGGGCAGVGE